MTGTVLNVITVLVGGSVGLLAGARLTGQLRQTLTQGLGLVVVVIGVRMALGTGNVLILLGSIALGTLGGELMRIETHVESLARWLEARASALGGERNAGSTERFVRGFVTTSLLFCVGPMTIVGSIQDGLTGDYSTLAVKSLLDGIASLVFSASLGIGVLFSALTVLVYQGLLTAGAALVRDLFSEAMIGEMTAAGGVLILAIGLNLLELVRIRVGNMLPALVFAPLITAIAARWGSL